MAQIKPKNYKSVISVEVLHQGPIPDSFELLDIIREAITGSYSHRWHITHQVELNEKDMRSELEAQDSDPSFFFPDTEE